MGNQHDPAPRWVRLIIDHNPFFLLSAICMMLGCYALNLALYTPAGDVGKLLVLIAVINVYEAALIGLGLLLLVRSGPAKRDAHTLLALEAFFLTDLSFVSGTISTIDARWGWGLNSVLIALAAAKLAIVVKALRIPRGGRVLALALVQVAILLAIPTVFQQVSMRYGVGLRRGFLPELAVYLAWWVAGLVPVIAAALLWPARSSSAKPSSKPALALAGAYAVVPFLSILVHVYGAGWVYNFYLASAEVSPILLGLAVGISALRSRAGAGTILKWQIAMILAALLLSLDYRNTMLFDFAGLSLNPARMALVGSTLVILHIIWLYQRLWAIVIGAGCIASVVLWPNLPAILAAVQRAAASAGNLLRRLLPRTAVQWGIISIVTSFILLAVGAIFSLRGRPEQPLPLADRSEQPPPLPEDDEARMKTEEPV